MFEKRLSKSIYFSVVFLIALPAFVIFTLLKNTPSSGNIFGFEDISTFEYWFIISFITLICLVCISSVLVLLRQIIKFNNIAFTVDREGIHDTFVSIILFSFIIILPVKLIPWSAVKEIKKDDDKLRLEINRKEVVASPVAKIILGIFGYDFCHKATSSLDESEKSIITTYCHQTPDCKVFAEEHYDEFSGYSKKTKAGIIILLIINAIFLIFTYFDYSETAELSCYLNTIFSGILGFENHPAFAEYFQIADNETLVYFEVDEGPLYYVWSLLKTAHIVLLLATAYMMVQIKPKFSARKLTLLLVAGTFLISLAGFTTLQFAVHNRIEANENCIISSKFNKEDVIISDYKDAEKVEVYISETEEDDDYSVYENAIVDVTVDGEIYSFYTDENTVGENIEKFISFFDEDIVEINTVS